MYSKVTTYLLLVPFSILDFALSKIPPQQLLMQFIKRNPIQDIDRINHIPQRFGHFPPIAVSYQTMAKNLFEGYLAGELKGEHDHATDLEE